MIDELRSLRAETSTISEAKNKQSKALRKSLAKLCDKVDVLYNQVSVSQHDKSPDTSRLSEIERTTSMLAEISLSGRRFAKESALLSSLDLEQRPARHGAIPVAHQKTFRWIFSSSKGSELGVRRDFPGWLSNGAGLFWISGKPGFGKSTLMKFIADARETKDLLAKWGVSK